MSYGAAAARCILIESLKKEGNLGSSGSAVHMVDPRALGPVEEGVHLPTPETPVSDHP